MNPKVLMGIIGAITAVLTGAGMYERNRERKYNQKRERVMAEYRKKTDELNRKISRAYADNDWQ